MKMEMYEIKINDIVDKDIFIITDDNRKKIISRTDIKEVMLKIKKDPKDDCLVIISKNLVPTEYLQLNGFNRLWFVEETLIDIKLREINELIYSMDSNIAELSKQIKEKKKLFERKIHEIHYNYIVSESGLLMNIDANNIKYKKQ